MSGRADVSSLLGRAYGMTSRAEGRAEVSSLLGASEIRPDNVPVSLAQLVCSGHITVWGYPLTGASSCVD